MKHLILSCALCVSAVALPFLFGATPAKNMKAVPQIACAAFSPDGKLLAAAQRNEVLLMDPANGKPLARLHAGAIVLNSVTFSLDGMRIIVAGGLPGQFGEIQLWDVTTKQQRSMQRAHKDAIYSIALSPDGTHLAAASYDKTISLWDVNPPSVIRNPQSLIDHTDAVYAVAFSPDGKLLASASGDRTVKVWDVATAKRLYTLSESTAELYTVAWSPVSASGGIQLAAGGVDRTLRVWNVEASGGTLARSTFAHEGAILRVLFTTDGKRLITSGEDRQVKFWNAETLEEQHVLERQSDWPLALALSPDGKRLAVGRYDGTLALYEAGSYAKLWEARLTASAARAQTPSAKSRGADPHPDPLPPARECGSETYGGRERE